MTVVTPFSSSKNCSTTDEEKVGSIFFAESSLNFDFKTTIVLYLCIFQGLEKNSQSMYNRRMFLKMALKETFLGLIQGLVLFSILVPIMQLFPKGCENYNSKPYVRCTNPAENISSSDLPRNPIAYLTSSRSQETKPFLFWICLVFFMTILCVIIIVLCSIKDEHYKYLYKFTPKNLLAGFGISGLFCGISLFFTIKNIPFENEIFDAIAKWAPMIILVICVLVYILLIISCKKYAAEWAQFTTECAKQDNTVGFISHRVPPRISVGSSEFGNSGFFPNYRQYSGDGKHAVDKEKQCQDIISQIVQLKKEVPSLEVEKISQLKMENPDLEIEKKFIDAKADIKLRKKSN